MPRVRWPVPPKPGWWRRVVRLRHCWRQRGVRHLANVASASSGIDPALAGVPAPLRYLAAMETGAAGCGAPANSPHRPREPACAKTNRVNAPPRLRWSFPRRPHRIAQCPQRWRETPRRSYCSKSTQPHCRNIQWQLVRKTCLWARARPRVAVLPAPNRPT